MEMNVERGMKRGRHGGQGERRRIGIEVRDRVRKGGGESKKMRRRRREGRKGKRAGGRGREEENTRNKERDEEEKDDRRKAWQSQHETFLSQPHHSRTEKEMNMFG